MSEEYQNIGRIATTWDAKEVNQLLADGWLLLAVTQYADGLEIQRAQFVLGQTHESVAAGQIPDEYKDIVRID